MHPVAAAVPSAYDGWTFLCCDRQTDPSGSPGLQLLVTAEQEHSQVGAEYLVHEQRLSIPMQVEWGQGGEKRELNW